MTRIIDWAATHSRMVLACLLLSIAAGTAAYISLPREGSPDIEIPAYFVSVPFPGISAEDSERLLVRPLESRLRDLDGLEEITSTAAENYAGVSLSFAFGIDRSKMLADIRDRVDRAESEFPAGASSATISEFSFSDFPVVVVVISGNLPERTLLRVANEIQETLESLGPVLEAGLSGVRDEMLEVIIDPLQLEAYNVSANELVSVVSRNNQLVAAGEIETEQGAFALKIPSSYESPQDVRELPIKVNGGRVVTLGDLADIKMTYQDRTGTSRQNGEATFALQVVKRKGANIIETSQLVKDTVSGLRASWPDELNGAISITYVQDQSDSVSAMVNQLQGSVLTAIAIVMIVVLAALGMRSAILVGFAIPTSFLLCFALLSVMNIAISNIVMFGLILSVGMLVDSAIVIVELGDRNIREGVGPMRAFRNAAKRMFWPIISSTATTLCAFLPMLFWPGMPGQFMGTLPVTIIFVLSASMVVALVFLPVVGGVSGRVTRAFETMTASLRTMRFRTRLFLLGGFVLLGFGSAMAVLNPGMISGDTPGGRNLLATLPGALLFAVSAFAISMTVRSLKPKASEPLETGIKRTEFGKFIKLIVGNPVMPVLVVVATVAFVASTVRYYMANNNGVTFFVETEPDQVRVYVRARGNLSLHEKDELVREVEQLILGTEGIASVFSTAGSGGLNNAGGSARPVDTIGDVQVEFLPWEERQQLGGLVKDSRKIMDLLESKLADIPGIHTDVQTESNGPQQGKPVSLRLTGDNWEDLVAAATKVRTKFDNTEGLLFIEDTRPLPGIDWQIDIDVEKAGRFGADVQTVGAMLQLVTRGILLDEMRVDSSDEEIEIRVRLPEGDRLLSTLDTLRIRTDRGLVPLSNFVTRIPVDQLPEISRADQSRYIDVRSDVNPTLRNENGRPMTPTERIQFLTDWIENEAGLPGSVSWNWTGDQEEQQESQTFLIQAFIGALGLMFAVLLAQFNSVYNSVLVLLAVVLSTSGVLIGMVVMNQPFSIIMTGTGIVALAGIVVNNNIVLIDTYQEYAKYMPRLEAIVRTAEVRIRPVLLTSITTIAGLTPMMYGYSIDIVNGGYTVNTPTSLWWKQLATAVVFGLSTATALTLVFTPSLLALRVWAAKGSYGLTRRLAATTLGKSSQVALDMRLERALKKTKDLTFVWDPSEPAVAMASESGSSPQSAASSIKPSEDATRVVPNKPDENESRAAQMTERALRRKIAPAPTPAQGQNEIEAKKTSTRTIREPANEERPPILHAAE